VFVAAMAFYAAGHIVRQRSGPAPRTTVVPAFAPSTTTPTTPRSCSARRGTTSRQSVSRTSPEPPATGVNAVGRLKRDRSLGAGPRKRSAVRHRS
jgi:hypothetical protein